MLCDSTSPLLRNAGTIMPESLQKLISRMHSAKKRRILAPNSLPVRRQNGGGDDESKPTAKKLSKLFAAEANAGSAKAKRSRIGLRNSTTAPRKSENRSPTGDARSSPKVVPPPVYCVEKCEVDCALEESVLSTELPYDTENNSRILFKPLVESTNTSRALPPDDGRSQSNVATAAPRKTLFTYPADLAKENIPAKFDLDEATEPNINFSENGETVVGVDGAKPSHDNSGIDSTVVIASEASPVCRSALVPEQRSTMAAGSQSAQNGVASKMAVCGDATMKSSLKSKIRGPKKWVTFSDIVQAESQTRYINDLDAAGCPRSGNDFGAGCPRSGNDSRSDRTEVQPVSTDGWGAKAGARDECSQITSQTSFVDELYADSPKSDARRAQGEDLAAGARVQNMIDTLRRINSNITKATSDISKMSLFFENYKDCI